MAGEEVGEQERNKMRPNLRKNPPSGNASAESESLGNLKSHLIS
jgi:hypothetical protein